MTATITVRMCRTSPLFGSVKPTASNSLKRPTPSPRPTAIPTAEAKLPIASASMTIERRTWRRVAPSVRRVASSRVRCAIVIDSEFAITNEPTKSAIPPNASRKSCRKLRKLSVSFASSRACPCPVRTCVPAGRTFRISAASCAGVTPGFAFARIWSSFPTRWKSRCEVGRSNPDSVAPPRLAAPPKWTMPEIFIRSVGPFACTPIGCPTLRSFLCTVASSITTWFARGQFPSTSVSVLSSGRVGSTLKPRFGAPPKWTTLPLSTRCAFPPTPPTASATSGRLRIRGSSDSSKGGAVVPLSLRLKADLPVTVASVPR